MALKSLSFPVPPSVAIAEGATTPDPGVAGAFAYSTTTGNLMQWNGTLWRSMAERQLSHVLLGSDLTSSSTTLADATGLSFAVKAGVTYYFRFLVVFQTAATTTGITLSVTGPASPTQLAYNCDIPTSATARVLGNRRTYDVASTGTAVDVINSSLLAVVEGVITPSADGTLQLRYASEIGSSNAVIKAGSTGQLRFAANASAAQFDAAPLGTRTVSGTSDTLGLADIGRAVQYTSASATAATIPPNSSVPYPIGTVILLQQLGAGNVTVTRGSGVALRAYGYASSQDHTIVGRYGVVAAQKIATDEWLLTGQYTPF